MSEHDVTYELVAVPQPLGSTYRDPGDPFHGKAFNLVCSCEYTETGYREHGTGDSRKFYINFGHKPTKSGKPRRALLRKGQVHIDIETNAGGGEGAPMEFVGKVIKPRVTHEVWIASRKGDMPVLARGRNWIGSATYAPHKPWVVLVKNSKQWTFEKGPFRERDIAWSHARQYLSLQGIEYEIEVADQADIDTITIPLGSITDYFEDLARRAKETRGTQQLLDLKEELENVEAAAALLSEARKHVLKELSFS